MVFGAMNRFGSILVTIPVELKVNCVHYSQLLKDHLIPFLRECGENLILLQDNCPSHISGEIAVQLKDNKHTMLQAPPNSPDLNIIEEAWAASVHQLHTLPRPKSFDDFQENVRLSFHSVTHSSDFDRYLERWICQLQKCVAHEGNNNFI